jgi:hypothetical protein
MPSVIEFQIHLSGVASILTVRGGPQQSSFRLLCLSGSV